MYPILFEFGPVKIYSYGLALAFAFIVSIYLARIEARRQRIPPEKIASLAFLVILSGILGARILYVLQNLDYYVNSPLEIVMLNKGGLSFYGGLILAAISAAIFLKRENLPALKTFDVLAPYLALGQAIGRIGCFLNGCCYGAGDALPVQLYASLGLLLIFIILRIYQSFLLYCLLYSSLRFFMEYLRTDNLPVAANLTVHQIISIAVFIGACIIWWKRCKNSASKFLA